MPQPCPPECRDRQHHEYRLWPINIPTPRAFRTGDWPKAGTIFDSLWIRLRELGIIRLHHKPPTA